MQEVQEYFLSVKLILHNESTVSKRLHLDAEIPAFPALSLSATLTLITQNVLFPVSLTVSTFLCLPVEPCY